jgi:hypothetical protein
MARRLTGQPSFVGAFCGRTWERTGADRADDRLGAPVAALVKPGTARGGWGRPSYQPLTMLKALLL